MEEKKFDVQGMTCASCQAHVQKAVEKLNGVNECNVNLLSNTMSVSFDEKKINSKDICLAVKKAGYGANIQGQEKEKKIKKEEKNSSLKNLIISISFLILLMYVSMGHMIGLPLPTFLDGYENALSFAFTQFLLCLPILIIYRRYFINGFKRLFKSPNMDSLIAVGSAASLIYGIFAIYMIGYGLGTNNAEIVNAYRHNLYFESSVMILTLVSIGKYLEEISKKRTTLAVEKLMELAPKEAVVLRNGKEVVTPIENILISDIVVVKKGDKIPVDGEIIEGSGSVEEANFTGESMPVFKDAGKKVFASTILQSGYLKIKTLKVGKDSSIENIIKLVDEASNSKAPISKMVDKVSLYFVPLIFIISMIVFISFMATGNSFEIAFNFAISVLVIACPCSLGLATPVAIMVGSGKGAECGLLIKNAEILENSQFIKTIVLDKTGTITLGHPAVTDIISDDKLKLLEIACTLENKSEHPLAFAINSYCKDRNIKVQKIKNYSSVEGMGVKGEINNKTYYAGNLNVLKQLKIEITSKLNKILNDFSKEGKTPLIFVEEKEVIGLIAVKDEIKDGSIQAIKQLNKMGIKIVMLTGDNLLTARTIANEVGIKDVISDVLPQEKMKIIQSLHKDSKHLVAMVGDGVNDALALTTADLGIAIGGGSDVAMDSADIILLKNNLLDVCNIISLSKRVTKTIKVNLFWAFFYNCIGVLLASGIFYPSFGVKLNPMIGSFAMSLSSIFVVLNALTINLFKPKTNNKDAVNRVDKSSIKKHITLNIKGMMCNHCVESVKNEIKKFKGVKSVDVSLKNGKANLITKKTLDIDDICRALGKIGYEAEEEK